MDWIARRIIKRYKFESVMSEMGRYHTNRYEMTQPAVYTVKHGEKRICDPL